MIDDPDVEREVAALMAMLEADLQIARWDDRPLWADRTEGQESGHSSA